MVKKSEVFVLFILLLIFNSSFIFAYYPDGTSAHETLYVDNIVPLGYFQEQVIIDGGLEVTGNIRGLLTPGGSSDDKVFLGLTTNLLFNAGLRNGYDVLMDLTNSDFYLPEEMNFLFDGKIDPVNPNEAPEIADFPIIFNISFPKRYLKSDLVAGWVASDFHPTSFRFEILVYGEPCYDVGNMPNGFCNLSCETDPESCDYSVPPAIPSPCNPAVTCDEEVKLGWIVLYSNTDYQESSFAMLFDRDTISASIVYMLSQQEDLEPDDFGTNIKIGSMRLTINAFNSDDNIFQLAEIFFLDGLNEPYPDYYAALSGANFFGDVVIDADLTVSDSIYADSAGITDSLDAGSVLTTDLTVEGDIIATGDICANEGTLCLDEPIWTVIADGIQYLDGLVGIGRVPVYALDVLGSVKISNSVGNGGLISASGDGDVLLSTDDSGDIIIKLS